MPEIEIKQSFEGGLDLDTAYSKLSKDVYVDALNMTRDSVASGQDNIPSNIVSNRLVNANLKTGTNKTIGSFPYPLRNTVIEYIYNSNGYNTIMEYDNTNRTRTVIFQSLTDSDTDILEFDSDGKISSVNVYPNDEDGDLLFFLDTLGRPTVMNITRFKNNEYNPVTRDIIDVGKRPPLSPPACVYANDGTQIVNYFRKTLTKYCYIWVYDDNEESTCSPESAVPLPDNILDPDFTNISTNNNLITITANTGPKNVKSIKILMSYAQNTNNWSDFSTIININKEEEGYSDDTDFSFDFYNNGTYPVYEVARRIQLFDYVPITAECQEMPNGNHVAYGGTYEGLSRELEPNVDITIDTVAAGGGIPIGSLNGTTTVVDVPPFGTGLSITFTGVPATGTVVNVYLITTPGGVQTLVGTYTTLAGDSVNQVAAGIAASYSLIGIMNLVTFSGGHVNGFFTTSAYDFNSLEITPPSTSTATNSIATWKFSTRRTVGVQYYNQKGVTNGILYSADVSFPAYAENGSQEVLLPYLNFKIYHRPPEWAYSYQILFSKQDLTWLYWETVDVLTDNDFIYFNITNIGINATKNPTVANVLSYQFADGDRLRLIRRMSDGNVFGSTFDTEVLGQLENPSINGVNQTGTFIKINKADPFAAQTYTSKFFVIELYRPSQTQPTSENKTFLELGVQFPILDPETDNRVHGGEVTNQSVNLVTPAEFNIYEGDAYFRGRTVYLSVSGLGTFPVQDPNFVDSYTSAVSSVSGRPSVIDIFAKPTYFPAVIRFSQAVQTNTNINGLNRFYELNYIDCDLSFGRVMRMYIRDRQLEIFQYLKTGFSPIFSQLSKTPNGGNIFVTTDKLLNPVQYYQWEGGIGTAKASLAFFGYAFYYCDPVKGDILRLSRDGVSCISQLYKVNSWAIQEIPLRTNDNIIGAFDQKAQNYIFTLEAVTGSAATTRTFNEKTNSFESRLSYIPEMMCTLGTLLITYKNGQAYTHDADTYNNFYGTQYPTSVTIVWNDRSMLKKKYLSIGYQSLNNVKWISPENGDVLTSTVNPQTGLQQISQLKESDYELQEIVLSAGFLYDANSRSDAREGVVNGDYLGGSYVVTKLVCPAENCTELVNLSNPYITWIPSNRNF